MAGRKKLPPATPGTDVQISDKTPPAEAAKEIAARAGGELTSLDEAIGWMEVKDLVGRIKGLDFSATVAARAIAETFITLKKTGTYIGAPYKDADGKSRRVATLDEFCRIHLGKSLRRCEELARNYEMLGPELYEAAQRIGIGQRDYNALKVLPADDQDVIKAAIAEGGDKDAVVGILTALVERQAVEKAAITKDLANAQANYDAREARINELSSDNNELREKLSLLPRMRKPEKAEKAAKDFAVILADARAHLRHAQQSMEKISELAIEADYDLASDAEIAHAATETARLVAALLDGLERAGIAAPAALVRDAIGG